MISAKIRYEYKDGHAEIGYSSASFYEEILDEIKRTLDYEDDLDCAYIVELKVCGITYSVSR